MRTSGRLTIVFLFLIFFIGGCMGKQAEVSLDVPESPSTAEGMNYVLEPADSMGFLVTEWIRKGEFDIYKGVFPIILGGEYFLCRIRWNGITIQKDGKEFFTQFLLSPENGILTWTIVIDGHPDKTARTVVFSSMVDYVHDAFGEKEFFLGGTDFCNKFDHRSKFVLENGTPINDLKKVDIRDFIRDIKTWNVLTTEKGDVVTSLTKENLRYIAGINPQYAEWEKRLSESHVSVFYADPISIGVFNALETMRTEIKVGNGGVPSIGWDYRSVFPNRRAMGENLKMFENMKKERYRKNTY